MSRICGARGIASTPPNHAMLAMCPAFNRRMRRAVIGSFQSVTSRRRSMRRFGRYFGNSAQFGPDPQDQYDTSSGRRAGA
jgi:hypothetical protein